MEDDGSKIASANPPSEAVIANNVTAGGDSDKMLDVHAPHGAARTWKDFWIHLGTISIGLLIAIGLSRASRLATGCMSDIDWRKISNWKPERTSF
jgi:hypothetical protein